MAEAARLSAECETALVREFLRSWVELNEGCFKSRLMPPTLGLVDSVARLGLWRPELRAIEISRKLVLEHRWGVVLEVLKHEMAHQYVHEVLYATSEPPHGPAFQQLCQRLGIDATACGLPKVDPGAAMNDGEQRILQRIARLLALAESSNVHEAEAAMNAAQRLMLKYNLEVGPRAARGYGFRQIGAVKGRTTAGERLVAMILGKHFFVEAIWVRAYLPLEGRHGLVLEICGTPANLEMAAYVHAFLLQTADRLWLEHKRRHGLRRDRERQSFLCGVMRGFEEKLAAQGQKNQEEGLVWAGDGDLHRYFRTRYPRVRYMYSQGAVHSDAHESGREAGRNIVLHRPVASESRGGEGRRLLRE